MKKTPGGTAKNLADQVEKALGLLRQGGEPGENEMRQRLLVTGTLALKELVELVPRVPIRTRARILETLVKLAAQESKQMAEQHTHVHMEKHEHVHWEGSQLQAAAKTAEEQERLRRAFAGSGGAIAVDRVASAAPHAPAAPFPSSGGRDRLRRWITHAIRIYH